MTKVVTALLTSTVETG